MNLSNVSILLLEDQPLVALDIEDYLRDAGVTEIHVISSCSDGQAWLNEHNPDLTILDIHLRDGDCSRIVGTLKTRSLPYIIYSASDRSQYGDLSGFANAPWMSKPADPQLLVAEVKACLGSSKYRSERRPGSVSLSKH